MINEIKLLNGHAKRPAFWIQAMAILSLLVVLQAKVICTTGSVIPSKNIADWKMQNQDLKNFKEQTKGLDYSEPVQNKDGKPKRSWVYAAVRAGDIEKLKYIVESIDAGIKNGSCSVPNILDLPDPLSGKTPLFRAIETNNPKLIEILLSSPNIDVTKVDSQERSPLRMAAILNKKEAFKLIWGKISTKDHVSAMQDLLKKDKQGYSLYASAYLPDPGFFGSNASLSMFKMILDITKDRLNEEYLGSIDKEIMDLTHNKTLRESYSRKLQYETNLRRHPKPSTPPTKKEKSE